MKIWWISTLSAASQAVSFFVVPFLYVRIPSEDFALLAYLQAVIGVAVASLLFKRDITWQTLGESQLRGRLKQLFLSSQLFVVPLVLLLAVAHSGIGMSLLLFALAMPFVYLFSAVNTVLIKRRDFQRVAIVRFSQSLSFNIMILICTTIGGRLLDYHLALFVGASYCLGAVCAPSAICLPSIKGSRTAIMEIARTPLLSLSPLANSISVNFLIISAGILFDAKDAAVLAFSVRILLSPVNLIAYPLSLDIVGGGFPERKLLRSRMRMMMIGSIGFFVLCAASFHLAVSLFGEAKIILEIWIQVALLASLQLFVVPFSQLPLISGNANWSGRWEWLRATALAILFLGVKLLVGDIRMFLLIFVAIMGAFYFSLITKIRKVSYETTCG